MRASIFKTILHSAFLGMFLGYRITNIPSPKHSQSGSSFVLVAGSRQFPRFATSINRTLENLNTREQIRAKFI
jgi:hypothetical protein